MKDSPRTCSRGEEQPNVKSGETGVNLEQEVESLIPVSTGYLLTFMAREFVKWKRMQKAKMVAIKRRRFSF